mmetsp:Transcript_45670/g.97547  ORF Transcript_45670/g.97547 Transcript_45670/m.97547 type:complete len:409 (+) Transcript_45670:54-1280(+)
MAFPASQSAEARIVRGMTDAESDDNTSEEDENEDAAKRSVGPGWRGDLQGLKELALQPLNLMMLFLPLGIASGKLGWGDGPTFWLNFLAIVPLAAILGASTENLAMHTGELIGGLLNATFGNAVEMIVTVQALRAGLVEVVQGSLLGSVLSNLLLVLGTAFLLGGTKFSEQEFNLKGATMSVSCMLLSSISMALPTLYSYNEYVTPEDVLKVSRVSAIVIASCYLLFLLFQLKTHVHLFTGEGDDEQASMSFVASSLLLAATTMVVAYVSEFLVDAIEGFSVEYNIPHAFIGVILLPIVGNAAEHTTAITAAMKNKMDLSIGIAVGSATQIALFVVPFSVLAGWVLGVEMSLDFKMFECGVMMLSVLIVSAVVADGYSNWLEGAMLVATYLLMAVMFFMTPDRRETLL